MTHSPGKSVVMRMGEWIAALVGAVNCIFVSLAFAQDQGTLFPLPGLYFIEIALLGVLVVAFVAMRPNLKARWLALPWVAAGIILAFVILGGFSIGPYLIPALIAFVVVGILADWQSGGIITRHIGLFLMAAVSQGAVMVVMTVLA